MMNWWKLGCTMAKESTSKLFHIFVKSGSTVPTDYLNCLNLVTGITDYQKKKSTCQNRFALNRFLIGSVRWLDSFCASQLRRDLKAHQWNSPLGFFFRSLIVARPIVRSHFVSLRHLPLSLPLFSIGCCSPVASSQLSSRLQLLCLSLCP